jgi:hypothetical protein
VTSPALSFFTLDHGTATVSAALLAPFSGRYRLLAAAAAPAGTDPEALLEDLVARVEAVEPGLLVDLDGWRDWARLECATHVPPKVVLAAGGERSLAELEAAFAGAGWEVAGRINGSRFDALAATELCLDPPVSLVAIGLPDPPRPEDRNGSLRVGSLVLAAAERREELHILACGPADGLGPLPPERSTHLPPPGIVAQALDSELRTALADLLVAHRGRPGDDGVWTSGADLPDGRAAIRVAVATLALLLDRRIEAVDVGHALGSRTYCEPHGEGRHLVTVEGALVPASALDDERELEAITRWSTARADPFSTADRVRNLRLDPWREAWADGARLRLACLRGALARLDAAWRTGATEGAPAPAADLLIVAGGAFAAIPAPAATLAVVDGMRRPGAVTLFQDHARLLAPIGTLPEDADRRRLLADLLDDALLPVGSAIVAGEQRPGARHAATLRVTSALVANEIELAPGALRLVDLPPGVPARVEVETREGSLLGVRARRVSLDVSGGLGGLLVDTRDVPLRLPDRPERRRALLEAWERPIWAVTEP